MNLWLEDPDLEEAQASFDHAADRLARIAALEAQLAERDARIAALTAAGDVMAPYAGHDDDCFYWSDRGAKCDCGYTKALAGWKKAKGSLST